MILSCISAISLACAPGTDGAESPLMLGNAINCVSAEEMVFAGDVKDGFGLSITVCLTQPPQSSEPRISIHYSGEGGTRTISCEPSQCSGIIDFSHYVRPRFSILTLTWHDENGVQRIIETFDAQSLDSQPIHSVTHSWKPADARAVDDSTDEEPQSYPVEANTQKLALLALEPFFF
jgi:hypothetical protein